MMDTFIIVNIKEKYMLFYSKNVFLFYSVWPGTEYLWGTHFKEELTNLL